MRLLESLGGRLGLGNQLFQRLAKVRTITHLRKTTFWGREIENIGFIDCGHMPDFVPYSAKSDTQKNWGGLRSDGSVVLYIARDPKPPAKSPVIIGKRETWGVLELAVDSLYTMARPDNRDAWREVIVPRQTWRLKHLRWRPVVSDVQKRTILTMYRSGKYGVREIAFRTGVPDDQVRETLEGHKLGNLKTW